MRKKVHIQTATIENSTLTLQPTEPVSLNDMVPSGQMIVDSDELAFVYLVKEQNEYTYIYLHETIWSQLKEAMEQQLQVKIVSNHEELVLENAVEELQYLVANIEGNGNYGEKMVEKVEHIFLGK
ncbi:hypothetical protein [Aeribacillus pallidus]|jgi:hypothetical protein|uniref:UPF0738 family protein n=1 Tax=Aeribacillus pallidus TaxID=33936 RepID=UPI003D2614F0